MININIKLNKSITVNLNINSLNDLKQNSLYLISFSTIVYTVLRSPCGQPVVDGHNDWMFQKLRENHQEEQEESSRSKISPAGFPRHFSSEPHYSGHIIILIFLFFFLCM